jgi:hypothetical protein
MLKSCSKDSKPIEMVEDSKIMSIIFSVLYGNDPALEPPTEALDRSIGLALGSYLPHLIDNYEAILRAVDKYDLLHVINYLKLGVRTLLAEEPGAARTAFILAAKLDDVKLAKLALRALPKTEDPLNWDTTTAIAMGFSYYLGVMQALNKCKGYAHTPNSVDWTRLAGLFQPC